MSQFCEVKVKRIPRLENNEADTLTKIASLGVAQSAGPITIEHIPAPNIDLLEPLEVGSLSNEILWMEPIIRYLKDGDLPSDKSEDTLYRRGFTLPYFKCLGSDEAEYVMREIYEGICGNHYGAQSLTQKTLRQGYYWPTMREDAKNIVRSCDKCQRFGIPYAIVSDNNKQFDNENFQSFCSELGIANRFATLAHPQSNGQVEAVNKIIKGILKKKLEERNGAWVDELPGVLSAYRTI
ncbi:uncharacterized protein LOC107174842 [Citrus sinensis]|uniref:uncharacterized protein LOC107174842 n=1 Tax=Citrus sinensis TaxID=2711 RepID=UPI0007637C76|nr:uncharacterized protein LOC107174842 [Citrus sinensis]XP_024033462.1 uncharacterized protein LOC112095592 [Citrus x clementina]